MKTLNKILLSALTLTLGLEVEAKENVLTDRSGKGDDTPLKVIAEACDPAQSRTDLAVNNVRTTILGGGDMWWDFTSGQYEIPVGSNKHSLFAGSLWIGGLDDGNQLKVAAMTYRQSGSDFWPGPIDPVTVSTDKAICSQYDKHYKVTLAEVKEYVTDWAPGKVPPSSIADWPAFTVDGSRILAPFVDVDGDGNYDPLNSGDYPAYDITGTVDCGTIDEEEEGILFGDETLFWIFNDKGDIHGETGAESIGLELHAQAFGFATNDEINNMTFYSYKIINRSTVALNQVYIGQWVDPDLGNHLDDYVGCDVARGLGYVFNGDNDDDGANGYGINPPALGIDFFQGPLADENDGVDNDRDCVPDEPGEQIIMSKFVYYNNDFSITGNPVTGTHYYNYLDGKWKDGQPIVYGGSGRSAGGTQCDFMFPGDSDQEYGWGLGGDCQNPVSSAIWTEETAGNTPADRRFLQSAGKFTLKPGAVNFVTIGAVWSRTRNGGAFASVEEVRLADDLAQSLFDNCFRVTDGPDAPTVDVIELDRKLVLSLSNLPGSNNFDESYSEKDPLIICFPGDTLPDGTSVLCDTNFVFEGYKIYQLADATVSSSELTDPDRARLIAQYDIENGIGQLVNYIEDKSIGGLVPTEMVNGEDAGISHSLVVTQDQFATGNNSLVNHKDYYFMAVAYAYNGFVAYDPSNPNTLNGQKKPYKAGRNNIMVYQGTPHKTAPENGGTELNSDYGTLVEVRRLRGAGNGGNAVYLTEASSQQIVLNNCIENPVYSSAGGPIKVKIVNPKNVLPNEYRVEMDGTGSSAKFALYDVTGGDTVVSPSPNVAIGTHYEHLYMNHGFSVTLDEVHEPGPDAANSNEIYAGNGFITASMTNSNPTNSWLEFIGDVNALGSSYDWIKTGDGTNDPNSDYENVLGGTWAPYGLVSGTTVSTTEQGNGPAWTLFQSLSKLENLPSVDVVFTSDKSLWTRVPVVETQDEAVNAEGGAAKMNLREGASVDKDGNPDGSGTGWSWFPGYAIDVDRGIRLNMMFGEDSWLVGDNGADMMWNPTSAERNGLGNIAFGGKHYIYVMNTQYTGSNEQNNPYYSLFQNPTNTNKRNIYRDVNWVAIPMLSSGEQLLSSDVKVSLRVNQPYIEWTGCGLPAGNPAWGFSTANLAAKSGDVATASSALDLIGIVPNPYYAYSEYEATSLENLVKVINLPSKCTVSIYTVNGLLIRRYVKESPETFIEWDLKNYSGIPIASGAYIFHIDAGDAGEKVLKWFGALRPVDLDSY